MTTPTNNATVDGIMEMVYDYMDRVEKASNFYEGGDDVRYHAARAENDAIDAALRTQIAAMVEREEQLRDALSDMLSGWRYIRQAHGDLYGVGWDRAQEKAEAALTANQTTPPPTREKE